MKDEILGKIRDYAVSKMEETEAFNDKVRRIKELEEDPKVREYSLLIHSINGNPRMISLNEGDILQLAFRQYVNEINLDDTNGVYVYMGTYVNENEHEKRVREATEDSYRKYWNIELGTYTHVSLADYEKFEEEHIVISVDCINEFELYRNIQNDFLKESINSNQEEAVKLVLSKYGKKDLL